MERSIWLASRLSAAFVGTAAVAILAAVVFLIQNALTCGPTCTTIVGQGNLSHCTASCSVNSFYDFGGALFWTLPGAVVLGFVPGIVALTLTPVRAHPWRALPMLIAGAMIGFVAWLCLATTLHMQYGATEIATVFAIPTAAGMLTALFLSRFPRFSNVEAT